MWQGDDGAPEGPANAKMPAAAPRPKPPVTGGAAPRPGTPGRAPPPPVPTAAKGPPPPTPDAHAFVAPDSTVDLDEIALADDDAAEVSLPPVEPDAPNLAAAVPNVTVPQTPAPPISPPPPIVDPAPVAATQVEPAKPRNDQPAATSIAPPFKKRSPAKALAFALLALVVVGGGLAYQSQRSARAPSVQRAEPPPSAEANVEPPPLDHEPAPPPTHTAEPPPSASAAKKKPAAEAAGPAAAVSADPASQGIIDTMQIPPGRKIIVDGRVVGTSPRRVPIRCGTHRIQIGELLPESIALPCGGEVSFTE